MRVVAADIALCSLKLDKPFRLGPVECRARDYVALRLLADDGTEGFAIGYRSGTPLFDTLLSVAPVIIGSDPDMRKAALRSIEDASLQGRAAFVRAASLLDIAMWDLTAKAAKLPLYRLLGGCRTRVPAVPVAGFSYQHRPAEDVERELLALADQGHKTIKIIIRGGDPSDNIRYVRRMAATCRDRASLIVDAQWAWRHVHEAEAVCSAFDDLGLFCLEDPFLPQQWRLAAELRTRIRTPVAVGEDTLDLNGFLDVVQAVDVLRVDATASGGITTALAAIDLASAFGRVVLPHVFPYLHAHLACASPTVTAVEYVPAETGTDPVRTLFRRFPSLVDGQFEVSEEPGVGVHLDWTAVTASAQRTGSVEG